MLKWIARTFFRLNGWTYENQVGEIGPKCILLAAPHTSNWDYMYGLVFFEKMGIPARIAMKKEWFRFPFKQLIEPIGGLPVDRGPRGDGGHRMSAVEAMAGLFKDHDELILVITPEGTRSKVTKWKTGFYYIALKANVPIVLSYLDYRNKRGTVGLVLHPSGDMEADMRTIMEFYAAHGIGKHADQFSVDERYSGF